MRPLTEPETKTLFEKLASYCGKGITNLIADPAGGSDRNVFRVQVRKKRLSAPIIPRLASLSNQARQKKC